MKLKLLTVKDVVERSRYSERTIRALIARGVLPVVRPFGRAIRIVERDFERVFLKKR